MRPLGRLLLIARLTRPDGELTDQGQDLAEELYQGREEPESGLRAQMGPPPVHPEARVY